MKLKLILDPISGRGKAVKAWPIIQKFFNDRKIIYDLVKTEYPGHGISLAKKAVAAGFDTIISIGGDGSTNEVTNGIIGSQATLGIIPCGDANDFPKMLGISEKNIAEACQVIAEGFSKSIDVGIINGRYFLNVVGIGIDGEISEQKAKLRKYLHGFLGYLAQTIPILLTYRPKKVKIKYNGSSLDASILSISIGNGRFCGGGFQFTPNAEITDGLLDICLTNYPGKLRSLWDLPKVPKGKHTTLPYISMLRAREISISSDVLLAAHIDGEVAKEKEYQIKILPKKLKVLAKKSYMS
jgi:YegS/Rv2252/BmrU family lipid kinase